MIHCWCHLWSKVQDRNNIINLLAKVMLYLCVLTICTHTLCIYVCSCILKHLSSQTCELLHSKLLKAKLSAPAGWLQLFWVLCLCPVCFHPETHQNDWFKCICLMYTLKKTTIRCSRGCLAEVRFQGFLWKEIDYTVLVLYSAFHFHHMLFINLYELHNRSEVLQQCQAFVLL